MKQIQINLSISLKSFIKLLLVLLPFQYYFSYCYGQKNAVNNYKIEMADIVKLGSLDSINTDTIDWDRTYNYYKAKPFETKNLLISIHPKKGKGIYMMFCYPSGGSYRTREYDPKGKFVDDIYIP